MRLAILASFAAALVAAPVLAADQSPPPQAGWQRPSPEQMEARRAEWDAKRSANIALLLGLRPDQKPALDGFLASSRPPHGKPGDHGFGRGPGDAPSTQDEGTVAALDHMSQHIEARDAEAKQRIEATRRFYTSLSPDQQQRFDALMQLAHGEFGHHGMGGRGDEHHRPMHPPMG